MWETEGNSERNSTKLNSHRKRAYSIHIGGRHDGLYGNTVIPWRLFHLHSPLPSQQFCRWVTLFEESRIKTHIWKHAQPKVWRDYPHQSPLWWRNSWPPIPSHHDQFCSRFLKILLFSPLYELSRRPDVCILCSEPMSFPSPMLGMTSLSIYNSSFEKVVNIDDMKNERDYNFLPCLARYLKWRECPQSHRLKLWQSQQMIKDIYYEKETE